jgi:hypothetical protein
MTSFCRIRDGIQGLALIDLLHVEKQEEVLFLYFEKIVIMAEAKSLAKLVQSNDRKMVINSIPDPDPDRG